MAFAAPVVAFAAVNDNDAGFAALFRFVVTPLFLFGGAFFPVPQLPPVLEQVAYADAALARRRAVPRARARHRDASLGVLLHVVYLPVWIAVGSWLAVRAFQRRLAV